MADDGSPSQPTSSAATDLWS